MKEIRKIKLPKAIGFDLGETLIHYVGLPLNWQALYPEALARVSEACSHPVTDAEMKAGQGVLAHYNTRLYPRVEEVTAERILREVLTEWGLSTAADTNRIEDVFFGFFQQTYAVYPDTTAALKELRNAGIKIGVLTDVPYGMPRRFVDRDLVPIADNIDATLTSVEANCRKPHPSGYLALAQRLGSEPCDMVYVGNEEKDIIGANEAGLFSVLIDRNGSGTDFGQDKTISSLEELAQVWRFQLCC